MENEELIARIESVEEIYSKSSESWNRRNSEAFYLTSLQFVKIHFGEDSEFYNVLSKEKNVHSNNFSHKTDAALSVLQAIKDYLKLNLGFVEVDRYNLKIDAINDFIIQAIHLLEKKDIHPVASAILMGAALEEYLKKLCEQCNVDILDINQTIDPVAQKLYKVNVISKQDLKDITSWAGIRNDATHGNFEVINDRKRIANAIEGVNLFMRKSDR